MTDPKSVAAAAPMAQQGNKPAQKHENDSKAAPASSVPPKDEIKAPSQAVPAAKS